MEGFNQVNRMPIIVMKISAPRNMRIVEMTSWLVEKSSASTTDQ